MERNVSASASASGGVGLLGLTFVALLVLKLAGLADLSWWWVFTPLFIGAGLAGFFFGVLALIVFRR